MCVFLLFFRFGFEDRNLIVFIPDHFLSVYFLVSFADRDSIVLIPDHYLSVYSCFISEIDWPCIIRKV